jgi:hypothetical protein
MTIQRRTDMYVSTLRQFIQAMGDAGNPGRLSRWGRADYAVPQLSEGESPASGHALWIGKVTGFVGAGMDGQRRRAGEEGRA